MFNNKVLVSLYVLQVDRSFEIFIPVNEKVGNLIKLFNKMIFNDFECKYNLLNLNTGTLYKNNDLIRNVDLKNGTDLLMF